MNAPKHQLNIKFIKAKWKGALGDKDNLIYLPPLLFKKLGLKIEETILLKIGSMYRSVSAAEIFTSADETCTKFFVSPDIADFCQIPHGTEITLRYDCTLNKLCIGPLIGLFTVRNIFPDTNFGSQEQMLKALTGTSEELSGFVFVFCPEDINQDSASITGYIPAVQQLFETIDWQPLKLPFPDVIYDRVPSRTVEGRDEVQAAKTTLMSIPTVAYFNPKFLNKWETFVALQNQSQVHDYLPPTQLITSPEDIYDFLINYGSAFIKPTSGSLGRHIIKVEASENGWYKFMYRSKDKQTIEQTVDNFGKLSSFLQPILRKRTYIIQKDVNLACYAGRPFDIRVLAQKDRYGNWRRTKIYARLAAPDSFLANLSDGACPISINTVLNEVFNTDFQIPASLGERIKTAIKQISPALEEGTGLTWGELGIDLGLDVNGHIWLIEINAKPFRALVSESGSVNVIKRSLMRPLEFAKYLSGFYRHCPLNSCETSL